MNDTIMDKIIVFWFIMVMMLCVIGLTLIIIFFIELCMQPVPQPTSCTNHLSQYHEPTAH